MSTWAPEMERTLRRLEDTREIYDLFMRYGHFLDTHDWERFGGLFTDTGQLVSKGGVGTATGPEEIARLFDERLKDVPVGSFHLFSNIAIDVDGDTASATSMWAYLTADDGGWPRLLMFGHYADELVRDGEEWKFQKRDIDRVMGSPPYQR